jgi:hypothetical protein
MIRRLAGALLVGCALLAAAPVVRAQDEADRLEARTLKEVEEATEILGKVQAGKMGYKEALAKLREFVQHAEELEAIAPKRAEKHLVDLNQTIYWTKKAMPLGADILKPDPSAPPAPAPSPAPAPAPDPAPAPVPAPAPAPAVPGFAPPALPAQNPERSAALLPLLGHATAAARAWACAQVAAAPDPALVEALFGLLLQDGDENVRAAAAKALVDARHDAVYEGFAPRVLKLDGDPLERLVDVMKEKPEPRTVAALFDLAMRFAPPIGGANSQNKGDMEGYKQRAKAAWGDGWRHRAIQIWRSWPEPLVSAGFGETWKRKKKLAGKALPQLQEILLAVGVIGNSRGIRHAVPFLTKGKEADSPLRAPALAAIELVGTPAVPWLAQGLGSGQTQLWCKQALWNITGQRLSHDPGAWIRWWNENR